MFLYRPVGDEKIMYSDEFYSINIWHNSKNDLIKEETFNKLILKEKISFDDLFDIIKYTKNYKITINIENLYERCDF